MTPEIATEEPIAAEVDGSTEAPESNQNEEVTDVAPEEEQTPAPTREPVKEKPKDYTAYPIAIENASGARFERYKNYTLCVYETAMIAFNKKGECEWAEIIQMSSPILKVSGDYIMIAEEGGSKVLLFNGNELVCSIVSDGAIQSADVSGKGDVVVVSEKTYYKGAVSVYNKSGRQVFVWNSGASEIIDADISGRTRRLAVSLLSTENMADSKIMMFRLNHEESYKTHTFENSVIYDLEYLGDTLNIYADDKNMGMTSSGRLLWTNEYGAKTLTTYSSTDDGKKLLLFDNSNIAELAVLNSSGTEKSMVVSEELPDCVDINNDRIAYNNGRTVIFSKTNGKSAGTYTCARDVQQLHVTGSKSVLIVYNTSIEFVSFK